MININGTLCPVLIPQSEFQSLQQQQQQHNASPWNVWQQPTNRNMPSPYQVFDINSNFSGPLQQSQTHTIQQAMRIKRLKSPKTPFMQNAHASTPKPSNKQKKPPTATTVFPNETKLGKNVNQTQFHSVSVMLKYRCNRHVYFCWREIMRYFSG